MSRAFFITSTGTGIGKTFVTCALAHQLRRAGQAVHAVKPIISGFDPLMPQHSDTAEILTALDRPLDPDWCDRISPWRLFAPLSPHLAAEREGKPIQLDGLIRWTRQQMHPEMYTLIEGAGGVMAPLTREDTVRDWMAALRIPAILVAGSYLGTFSHTLTAIEALDGRAIPVQAVVVSESEHSPMPMAETVASLRQFLPDVPHIVGLSRVGGWQLAPDLLGLLK